MLKQSVLFHPRSRLSAQIEKIPPQDSFHASKQVCHLLRSGVAALFGPESGKLKNISQKMDYLGRARAQRYFIQDGLFGKRNRFDCCLDEFYLIK